MSGLSYTVKVLLKHSVVELWKGRGECQLSRMKSEGREMRERNERGQYKPTSPIVVEHLSRFMMYSIWKAPTPRIFYFFGMTTWR
jgi:hypothetical protein